MNKRFTIYYPVAAYCGYTAYSLVKDAQEGAPASPLMNVVAVGFFSLAAVAIAVYTSVLARRDKRAEQKEGIEENSGNDQMHNEDTHDSQKQL